MEELRSTEILDREIRADSRKKAEKIIAQAKTQAESLSDSTAEKIQLAQKEAETSLDAGMALFSGNLDSSLPLEKQRFYTMFVHESLMSAFNEYFSDKDEDFIISVLKNKALKIKALFPETKFDSYSKGLSEKKVLKMLSEVFNKDVLSCTENAKMFPADEELPLFEHHRGIVLASKDGSVTVRLTLDQTVAELLDSKRIELASALLGKEVA